MALLSDWFGATTGEIVHVDGGVHAVGAPDGRRMLSAPDHELTGAGRQPGSEVGESAP